MEPAKVTARSKAAVASVADALTAHGFAAHAEARGKLLTLVVRALPVRRGRAEVPARAVRGRHRHGARACSKGSTARRSRSSRRAARRRRRTASPASRAPSARAYLDHASTVTAAARARCDAMLPVPASSHGDPGPAARRGPGDAVALENAREQVAAFFGARPREVVFTSSGTEAVNTASWVSPAPAAGTS